MTRVKQAVGALLLAGAPWLLSPLLPPWAVMVLAAWLLLAAAVALRTFDPMPHATPAATFVRGLGLGLATLALAQLVGVAMGGRDPLQPLRRMPPLRVAPPAPAPPAPSAPAMSPAPTSNPAPTMSPAPALDPAPALSPAPPSAARAPAA